MTSTELLVGTTIAATLLSLAVPHAGRSGVVLGGELASRRLVADLDHARAHAQAAGRRTGLVFESGQAPGWTVVEDGDGDGISASDIQWGIDTALLPPRRLSDDHAGIALHVGIDAVRPDSGVPLPAGSDPVQVGPSRILTFTPEGTSGSGTLYLGTDSALWCVRIFGATGRTRVLAYRPRSTAWEVR